MSSATTGGSPISSAIGWPCAESTSLHSPVPQVLHVRGRPLCVLDGQVVPLIELIPWSTSASTKMGLEHVGVVVGEDVDALSRTHRAALTSQQFQSLGYHPDALAAIDKFFDD